MQAGRWFRATRKGANELKRQEMCKDRGKRAPSNHLIYVMALVGVHYYDSDSEEGALGVAKT